MEEEKSKGAPPTDYQGNVLPSSNGTPKKEVYFKPSPIPRLAAAASLGKKIPTAGGYAIDRCKEPAVDFPPECMLYENQPWVLGKMNPAALVDHDYDEPEPTPVEPKPVQTEEGTKKAPLPEAEIGDGDKIVKKDEVVKETQIPPTPTSS